jgi:hypothetical protein
MHTGIQEGAGPALPGKKPTLVDWIDAQRAVREEEERLKDLAGRRPRLFDRDDEFERQRLRVQVVQDQADAIYDAVMQDLRMA